MKRASEPYNIRYSYKVATIFQSLAYIASVGHLEKFDEGRNDVYMPDIVKLSRQYNFTKTKGGKKERNKDEEMKAKKHEMK